MATLTNAPAIYSTTAVYQLHPQTCISCGVLFALAVDLDNELRQNHKTFYCPWGHGQSYRGKTDVQIAREERDAARSLAERESNRRRAAEAEAAHARRSAAAQRGWNTRIRNRIANGVCPCCTRSFENVRRHMETEHPDYAIPDERPADE